MANIIKRLARHRDDMRLANFQRVRGLDAEWKLLRCPTEYCFPNLTPPWANRNLGANRTDAVSGGIFKRDVNVAVCFHFCVNDSCCFEELKQLALVSRRAAEKSYRHAGLSPKQYRNKNAMIPLKFAGSLQHEHPNCSCEHQQSRDAN